MNNVILLHRLKEILSDMDFLNRNEYVVSSRVEDIAKEVTRMRVSLARSIDNYMADKLDTKQRKKERGTYRKNRVA